MDISPFYYVGLCAFVALMTVALRMVPNKNYWYHLGMALNLRLSESDNDTLSRLAAHLGVSKQKAIITAIRHESERVFPATTQPFSALNCGKAPMSIAEAIEQERKEL
ncbi:MAG: hypothetical protein IKZ87_06405 [Actinomycetaceae bacterium]|nr:hypothetical protein [Actinomycetaceae bacterium]